MRIDNSYLSGLGASELRQNAEAGKAGQKAATRADSPSSSSLHVPSPELDRLRQLLQVSPDVRPDVMARVAQLLDSGYYATPEAADKTADAMINAID